MDTVEKFHSPSRFIRLQVTYQMPACRGPSQCQDFFLGFLHSILAEVCNAGLKSIPQSFNRVCLADRDQSDLVRRAMRAPRGRRNPMANVRKSFAQGLKCE